MKDQTIEMNIKQKARIKLRIISIFSQIKLCMSSQIVLVYSNADNAKNYIRLEDIIYQNVLPIIIASPSMERTFMTNPLILM